MFALAKKFLDRSRGFLARTPFAGSFFAVEILSAIEIPFRHRIPWRCMSSVACISDSEMHLIPYNRAVFSLVVPALKSLQVRGPSSLVPIN